MKRELVALAIVGLALAGCAAPAATDPAPQPTVAATPTASPSAPPEGSLFNPSEKGKSAKDLMASLVQNGVTEEAAVKEIEAAGMTHRVVMRDTEMFPVTADYREDRINLTVENGVVIGAFAG